jgi:hypothetical protein
MIFYGWVFPFNVYVYGVITECCVVVGLVMFCICGVHGSGKLHLILTLRSREIYNFCRLLN